MASSSSTTSKVTGAAFTGMSLRRANPGVNDA
jgi:hypothetical protein